MHLDHSIPELAWAAAAITPAAAAVAVALRGRLPGRTISHILAAVGVSLLVYSLAGPGMPGLEPVPRVAVFALDSSDSIGDAELERALSSALDIARDLSTDGVSLVFVAFDSGARRVDPGLRPDDLREGGGSGRFGTSSVSAALLAVSSALEPGVSGRAYLFSDGRFSEGRDCPCSGSSPVPVFAFPVRPRGSVEVRVEAVDYSRPLEQGTPARVWATLVSNATASGILTLDVDGSEAGSVEIGLEPGKPFTHVFTDLNFPRGNRRLSARFQGLGGAPDALPARTSARVLGPPKVLLVDCPMMRALAPLKALEAQEFDLNAATWDRFGEIETLEEYDAVLICPPDDPADAGDAGAKIARYVANGGGLVILAGRTGFGPAWNGSPLASISPVEPPQPAPPPPEDDGDPEPEAPPDPPSRDPEPEPEPEPPDEPDQPQQDLPIEIADVAIIFLIDKSGSMAGAKIRLAREAAIAAVGEMADSSRVGVLAFDTEAQWLVPVTRASEREWITDRLSRLQAGGGTNIFPALVKSLVALKEVDSRIKHVILVSDGYNQTMEDFKGIIIRMRDAGVSLSTIGVGEQFDTRLLSQLTYWAGPEKGRFDFAKDFNRIPRLVVDQTRWAMGDAPPAKKDQPPPSPPRKPPPPPPPPPDPPRDPEPEKPKEPVEKVPMRLRLTHPSPPFRGIPEAEVPSVYGHRRPVPGPLADVLASAPDGSGVIVFGEHGLGRVLFVGIAFDEDWGPDWIRWESLPRWMGQAVRWIKRRSEDPLPPTISFSADKAGRVEVEIVADTSSAAPEDSPVVAVRTAYGDKQLAVLRTGTHRFCAPVDPSLMTRGNTVRVEFPPGAGSTVIEAEAPLAVPLPFERSHIEADEDALRGLSRETGGVFAPDRAKAVSFPASNREKTTDVSWVPLLAALLMVPLAALLRRREVVAK